MTFIDVDFDFCTMFYDGTLDDPQRSKLCKEFKEFKPAAIGENQNDLHTDTDDDLQTHYYSWTSSSPSGLCKPKTNMYC